MSRSRVDVRIGSRSTTTRARSDDEGECAHIADHVHARHRGRARGLTRLRTGEMNSIPCASPTLLACGG
jgi:hypothetical protein